MRCSVEYLMPGGRGNEAARAARAAAQVVAGREFRDVVYAAGELAMQLVREGLTPGDINTFHRFDDAIITYRGRRLVRVFVPENVATPVPPPSSQQAIEY